jgi:hypothetical protein
MLSLRCSTFCHVSVGNDRRTPHRLIDLTEAKDLQNTLSYDSELRSQDVQYPPC